MANRKRANPRTPEARYIASRELDARRHGMTQEQYAKLLGINPRTLRKIRSGETPGTQVFKRKAQTERPRSSSNVFTTQIEIVPDPLGRKPTDEGYVGEVRSVNVLLPNYRNAKGESVAPTPFDIARYPHLLTVAAEEAKAMQNRYGYSSGSEPRIIGLRPVASYRKIPIVIRGVAR